MGVGNAAHVHRFYNFMKERAETDNPIESYLINTTGRVGARYVWVDTHLGDEPTWLAKTLFEELDGKKKPVGGTGPTIEETQLFLIQATRGAVDYEPHPLWGDKNACASTDRRAATRALKGTRSVQRTGLPKRWRRYSGSRLHRANTT